MGRAITQKGAIMTINREDLQSFLNQYLNIAEFNDYGPNGLQIEGKDKISKIAYAVSATRDSILKAVEYNADALIVHHGLFWKFHGAKTITDAFAKRVRPLIQNDINLFGYHLPLDAHMECGNAASIAKRLQLNNLAPFGDYKGMPIGVKGSFLHAKDIITVSQKLEQVLDHKVIVAANDNQKNIQSIGIITGGANSQWIQAQAEGLDAYLTGEISEHDWHEAQEGNVVFFAGGHNATEQYGIQELMKVIQNKFGNNLEHYFIKSMNPA